MPEPRSYVAEVIEKTVAGWPTLRWDGLILRNGRLVRYRRYLRLRGFGVRGRVSLDKHVIHQMFVSNTQQSQELSLSLSPSLSTVEPTRSLQLAGIGTSTGSQP